MNKREATEYIKILMFSPCLPFHKVELTGVTEIKFLDRNGKRFRIKVHND